MRRFGIVLLCAVLVVSVVTVSAHMVKGLGSPGLTSAFVSSPSGATDALVKVAWGTTSGGDTGLRVMCFFVANTSTARLDRERWPRVTAVGLELPDSRSGFVLISPLDGEWELVEDTEAFLPGHGSVSLDFAIVARVNPTGVAAGLPHDLGGIPPGQPSGIRGIGTRFCVSGPFPDLLPDLTTDAQDDTVPATIENLLNGVVVSFGGVAGNPMGTDAGVWFPAPGTTPRTIPLYPNAP